MPPPGAFPGTTASHPAAGRLVEVADRVWVARHAWLDLNVTVVGGDRGLVVVDTCGSEREVQPLLDQLAGLTAGPAAPEVVAVVNTHEHFDHTLGNAAVRDRWPGVPVHAHEHAAAQTGPAAERAADELRRDEDEHADEVGASRVVPADHTFSSVQVIDLGDRAVELVHPGRGHTAGDLVALVADAGVLVAGDLVEESAPPAYGPDSHPLAWPETLDLVLELTPPDAVVVPGHGGLVDRDFVVRQRDDIGRVAQQVLDLAGRGVPRDEALAGGEWPFPRSHLAHAVVRGYAHLPPAARRLPMA